MRSFSLLRTNTGLSTNLKFIIDSQYNFYLESIDSTPELSSSRFKKVQFNKSNYIDELIPFFYKDFPVDLAFSIKYDSDNYNMSTDFSNQYDDIYYSGARNIIDNKNYTEEYEYFAPLYVFKHALPKYFIIFRIDGPGLINLTKDNFKEEFLKKLKTIKVIDLTKNSVLGEWMNNNFTNNLDFPVAPLDVDFNELEFTKWIGIDYDSGGYTYKSLYLDENLENENTLFDFERSFLDGYKINKIIFPHILNMSYLFDDTPSTPTSLRKWSLNRYSGFYFDDMEKIDSITPFVLPKLRDDIVIYGPTGSGNIIASTDYGDPFLDGYRDDIDMWVEYKGDFFIVKKFEETLESAVNPIVKNINGKKVITDSVTSQVIIKYRIISELNLSNKQSELNKRSCFINDQNQILKISNSQPYVINNFTFADVNLIEINGVFHNLILEDGIVTLVTDYGFKFSLNNVFTYYTNSGEVGYSNDINLLIGKNNNPISFNIYRCKFTDIKDFDINIIDSEFSKFEYEKRNDITLTEETKMILTDLRSQSSPQDFDDFTFNGKTENIPVSSDYTANWETFRISDNKLTDIWRKNPIHVRWGYQNSLSSYDYPYLLNNNDIHEEFNRSVNTQDLIPNRSERNLDYFYTINSGTTSYLYHSLHIERNYGSSQDSSYRFELDKYLEIGSYSLSGLNYSYDFSYFDMFFSTTQSFIDGELVFNKNKYSLLESGDNVIPNTTVFRGIKFRLFEVDNIKYNTTFIENINLFSSNLFQDYKFSILLSSNDWMVSDNGSLYKPYEWDYFIDTQQSYGKLSLLTSHIATPSNVNIGDMLEIDQFFPYMTPQYQATPSIVGTYGMLQTSGYGIVLDKLYATSSYQQPGIWRKKMQWKVIKSWEYDTKYQIGDYVLYEGIPFKVLNSDVISNPLINPVNSANYQIEYSFSQFWNYSATSSWVYRFDEYYYYSNSLGYDFWNPSITYSIGDKILYDNRAYQAIISVPIGIHPVTQNRKIQSSSSPKYWREIALSSGAGSSNPKWNIVSLWDKNLTSYNSGIYACYNDILYISNNTTTSDDIPGQSLKWNRVYSFVPDTNYIYKSNNNSIIKINDSYYYCIYNPDLTIDSGITIYINKKWKNVLVNIAINDNTICSNSIIMDETKNIERDHLYVETNGRLTAANFIRQINDLDSLYGFADYTSYVIIEEDGTINKYDFKNNLSDLPYLLICEEPDNFKLKTNSLSYKINTVDKTTLKPSRYLINGQIDNLEKIDFYNNLPLGSEISTIKSDDRIMKNLNNQKSEIFKKFFRHSGYYMPIFYNIELFTNSSLYDSGSLCDIQFVLETDGSEITFKFQSGDISSEIDIVLDIPSGNTQEDWENYYQQIIDLIKVQDIFFGKTFIFDVYAPGDENIHTQMSNGHYVLSIKYKSDVCDAKISASQKVVCKSILQYLFEVHNFNAEAISGSIISGFTVPKSEQNLCCPDCGPQFLSYLQYQVSVGPSIIIKTPFQDFIEDISSIDCNISATGSGANWTTFESFANSNSISITNSIDFDSDFQDIYSILPSVLNNGVGQYGSPDLLSTVNDLILLVPSNQANLLGVIFSKGLKIYCDNDNYYVTTG